MSFANKGRDSRDTAALRKEYEKNVQALKDNKNADGTAKLHDVKAASFQRVVDQITAERRENLAGFHKVLINQGKLKTHEQVAAEKKAAETLSPRGGK